MNYQEAGAASDVVCRNGSFCRPFRRRGCSSGAASTKKPTNPRTIQNTALTLVVGTSPSMCESRINVLNDAQRARGLQARSRLFFLFLFLGNQRLYHADMFEGRGLAERDELITFADLIRPEMRDLRNDDDIGVVMLRARNRTQQHH